MPFKKKTNITSSKANGLENMALQKYHGSTSKLKDNVFFLSLACPKTCTFNFTYVAKFINMFVIITFRHVNLTSMVLG
jgi:hypothetical protein